LKLDNAVFVTRLEPLPEADWGADGAERVRFEVATNPGATPGPLMRIASGGELSRLLLALRVVLARVGTAPTLVFDEVDSGIGGAVAAAVGERLARLDDELQVLVVTHSPQVAARAAHHFRVVKDETKTGAVTRVDALDDAARREEVARMLAGKRITDEARAAADSLIRAAAD
jgi:DNA repair protein RecN (Recombination protein N)